MGAGSGDYFHFTDGNDDLLIGGREKYKTPANDNQPKGAKNRQQTGLRERGVGHPKGQEHGRRSKKKQKSTNTKKLRITPEDIGRGLLTGSGVAIGGYIIYRGIRLLPSLIPQLWWTIPTNLATP